MRVLITGSNGQLGSEIRELEATNNKKLDLVFKDLPGLDICNFNLLQSFIIDNHINAVINCAAYTAVDKAEQDAEIAEEVNSKGVLNLVNALKSVNGKLIHISNILDLQKLFLTLLYRKVLLSLQFAPHYLYKNTSQLLHS